MDISSCPQTRKNVLFDKAREAFASASTTDTYYRFMRPYLGETRAGVGPASRKPRPSRPRPSSLPRP